MGDPCSVAGREHRGVDERKRTADVEVGQRTVGAPRGRRRP